MTKIFLNDAILLITIVVNNRIANYIPFTKLIQIVNVRLCNDIKVKFKDYNKALATKLLINVCVVMINQLNIMTIYIILSKESKFLLYFRM